MGNGVFGAEDLLGTDFELRVQSHKWRCGLIVHEEFLVLGKPLMSSLARECQKLCTHV